jgi:hypothetical protein
MQTLREEKADDEEFEDSLEIVFICTIYSMSLKKIFFSHLSVLSTTIVYSKDSTKYSLASRSGQIDKSNTRKNYTAEIVHKYSDVEGFEKNMSL